MAEEVKLPEPRVAQMSRASLLLTGISCKPGARAWGISATQAEVASRYGRSSARSEKVGITKNGRCYHHVSCHVLFCRGGPHRGTAYHSAVTILPAVKLHIFNASRLGTVDALDPCPFCQERFYLGELPW